MDPELDFLFEDVDFDPETDWLEVTDLEAPQHFTLTERTSDVQISGWVEPGKLKACLRWLLGYPWVGDDLLLHRELPAWCPYAPWLYCSGITGVVGVGPDGREGPLFAGGVDRAVYVCYKVTARFSHTPWLVRSDHQIAEDADGFREEWKRFCTTLPKPYTEWLEVPGGFLVYDGAPGAADEKPIQAAKWRVKQQKQIIELQWIVPYDFVYDENDNSPKFSYMDGSINEEEFLGRAAQTLLCDGIKVEKYNLPVATEVFESELYLAVVTFTLKYFNPPIGGGSDAGWQVAPFIDGAYYAVKRPVAAVGIAKNYPEFDFRKAFTHWSLDNP